MKTTLIALFAVFGTVVSACFGNVQIPGQVFHPDISLPDVADRLRKSVEEEDEEAFRELETQYEEVVRAGIRDRRPGWMAFGLSEFAKAGPETNAIYVVPPVVSAKDMRTKRVEGNWENLFTKEQVEEGLRRNRLARRVLLTHFLEDVLNPDRMVPLDEWRMAIGSIWGKDVEELTSGKGMNGWKFRREQDDLPSLLPVYDLFLLAPDLGTALRHELEGLTSTWSSAVQPAPCRP